jgi:hypothetical protein
MWTANESACICRASSRYSWSTGANGAAAASRNQFKRCAPRRKEPEREATGDEVAELADGRVGDRVDDTRPLATTADDAAGGEAVELLR